MALVKSESSIPPTKGELFKRLFGVVVGAVLGGAGLGSVTTLERAVFHSKIYLGPFDLVLHFAWALLLCSLGCLLIYTTIWSALRGLACWTSSSSSTINGFVGGATGALFGSTAFRLVLAPSKYFAFFSPSLGASLGAILGAVAAMAGLAVFQKSLRHFPRTTMSLAAILVGLVLYVDLHRYILTYGNVHLMVGVCLLVASGFLGARATLKLSGTRTRALALCELLLLLSCIAILVTSRPTPGARKAVLQYGVIERSLIRNVLWPLTDADDDGFSGSFWGADCDDENPAVNPLGDVPSSPYLGCRQRATSVRTAAPPQPRRPATKNQRDLVWIIIDTLRSDVTAPYLPLFPGFASFPNYRSCGSNTAAVLAQLFGRRGCRPETPDGLFVSEMNAAGYDSAAFLPFKTKDLSMLPEDRSDAFDSFSSKTEVRDETVLLHEASAWIAREAAQGRRHFAYVHLVGGHSPYSGRGSTPKERYTQACANALMSVSRFVANLSPNTMVVVMGDHGEEFDEHGGTDHALTLYEEALETPLIIRAPMFSPGVQACSLDCPALVSTVFRGVQGGEIPPALCADKPNGRFAALDHPIQTPRVPTASHARSLTLPNGYKIIWDLSKDLWELYDLRKDPLETTNFAQRLPEELSHSSEALLGAMEKCPHGSERKR